MNQQKLYELSCKHLWLPFTQMKDYEEAPLIIERGEGVRLKDIEGKTYLDGYSSLWLNVHGHRKREIDEAIQKQLQKIAHSTLLGAANVPSILLAEKLVHITPPSLTRVFYSDSGAESVEIAIKMAYQYWQNKGFQQKTKFVTLANGYHGDTVGAISVGAIDLYHRVYRPLMFDSFVAPFPADYNNTHRTEEEIRDDALQKMQQLLAQNHEQIAAVIVESIVQGAGGMHIMPQGYLKGLAQLCKKYQVLLIVDEVATGFGRTGKLFAVEHEQVEPDLMTIAKGITGGYLPIAATMTTEEVYEAFYGDYLDMKTFFHGHSYTGNQLGCAAALANIELFEQTGLVEQVVEKAQYVATKMEKIRRLPHVGDVRQLGLICGIEIVADKETRKPFAIEQRVAYRTTLRMRELGLLTRPLGEVIVFMPPLVASYEELDEMLDIYTQAIEEVALLHGKTQVAFEK